jgi:hypothetical protein
MFTVEVSTKGFFVVSGKAAVGEEACECIGPLYTCGFAMREPEMLVINRLHKN